MFTAPNERGDLTKRQQILSFWPSQRKPTEERKHPALQIDRTGGFVVEDSVLATSDRSYAEYGKQELWEFCSDLRHIERQRHAPRQAPITLSTERDIETSLSFDESRNVVPDVIRDPIQPA